MSLILKNIIQKQLSRVKNLNVLREIFQDKIRKWINLSEDDLWTLKFPEVSDGDMWCSFHNFYDLYGNEFIFEAIGQLYIDGHECYFYIYEPSLNNFKFQLQHYVKLLDIIRIDSIQTSQQRIFNKNCKVQIKINQMHDIGRDMAIEFILLQFL
jgi:hypothetical protein